MHGKEYFIANGMKITVILLTDAIILLTVTTHSISSQKKQGKHPDKHPMDYLSISSDHTNR